MYWWLVLAVVIAAALAYGYWTHNSQSRDLARVFALLAAKHRGEVKAGSLLVLPQLRFERDSRRFLVTAMANSGAHEGGSGPFTFVDVTLPFDTGRRIRVERGTGVAKRPTTGDPEFDDAFRVEASNRTFAASLLTGRVRRKLVASPMPRLDVRVTGQKISVHSDGIATSKAEFEELIDIAALVAENCSAGV